MARLRLRVGLLVAWTWALGALGGLGGAFPLSRQLGTCALLLALGVVAIPRLARLPLRWLALPPLLLWVLVQVRPGAPAFAPHLSEILLGAGVLLVTTFLAARAAQSVQEFSEAISQVILPGPRRQPRRFRSVQRELYREVRRARLSHQPLTLLAISPQRPGDAALPAPLAQEALRALSQEYVFGRVMEFLSDEAKNCDMIARMNHHLVILLPLTPADDAAETVRRLCERAQDRLGLHLAIGQASFPDEEVTLVGLLERALAGMRRQAAGTQPPPAAEARHARRSRSAAAVAVSQEHAASPLDGVEAPVEGPSGQP